MTLPVQGSGPAWVPARPRRTGASPGTGAQPRARVHVSWALGPGEVAPGWGSGLKPGRRLCFSALAGGPAGHEQQGGSPEPTQSRAGGALGHNPVPGTGQRGAPSSQTSTATHPDCGAGEPLPASRRPALPGIRVQPPWERPAQDLSPPRTLRTYKSGWPWPTQPPSPHVSGSRWQLTQPPQALHSAMPRHSALPEASVTQARWLLSYFSLSLR